VKTSILSILIPVFNEKSTILGILKSIEKVDLRKIGFEKEVIIVDDGSTDGTTQLLKDVDKKYKILYHSKNEGKGAAIKTALKEVTGDYVIIQDADFELNPQDYEILLSRSLKTNALVVYGSRWLVSGNRHSQPLFYFGGLLLTFLVNLLYGQKLTDVLACYKLFKTEILKDIDFEYPRFEFGCEVTVKLPKKGIKIPEVPIDYQSRKNGSKKIRLKDGFKMFLVLLKYKFKE